MKTYGATDNNIPLESPSDYQRSDGSDHHGSFTSEVKHAFDPHKLESVVPIWMDFDDLKSNWRKLLRELFAEWFGTMLFVLVGTGSVAASAPFEGRLSSASVVVIAMGFGWGITTMIYATANISGGHLNPAVTIAVVFARKMPALKGLLYWIAQCMGAICGSLLLKWSLPEELCQAIGYGATTLTRNGTFGPNDSLVFHISPGDAIVMEMVLTFLLVLVIFATASLPGDKKEMGSFAPQAIGLAVLCGHLVGIPFTGPSMNPARSFGPAVVGGVWTDHWVYWVGPLLGGFIASIAYTLILSAQVERAKAEHPTTDLAAPQ